MTKPKIIFILFFLIYSTLGNIYIKLSPPKGDELHYLLTSISLIKDGDFDLKNNYDNKDYREFFKGEIDRHTTKGRNGEYLYHGLGIFQVILAPFYLVGGRFSVTLFLSLISSFLIYQTYRLCLTLTKSKRLSVLTVILAGLTIPLIQYSFLAFVEMLAGLVITTVVLRFVKNKENTVLTSLLVGILPWVHLRFLPVAIFLLLLYGYKNKKLFYSLAPIAAYFLFTFYLFGTFDPTAPTKQALAGTMIRGNIPVNLANILVDRRFGLFIYSPLYVLIFLGLPIWFKKNKKSFALTLGIAAAYLIPTLSYYDWHGGYSPPARYLTPTLPVLIPALVFYGARLKKIHGYLLISLLGIIGVYLFTTNFRLSPNHGFIFINDPPHIPLSLILPVWAIILGFNVLIFTKNKFGRLMLVFFGIFLAAGVLEISLRLFFPHTTLKFYDNEVFGSALLPNQKGIFVTDSGEYKSEVKVNSHGWPDVEHSYEKPEGVYRILILGDSFVENFQVPFEKRFFRQLEGSLNQAAKFEVIAIGRGNTGTAQQYFMLKNYGLKYNPDLVVQMFFEANDIQNNSPILQNDIFLPYFIINEEGNLVESPHGKRSERSFARIKELLKSSRLVTFLLSVRQRGIEKRDNLRTGYPVAYHVYDQNYSEDYQKAWETTEKLILLTKNETEKSGADYILVPFPGSEQVGLEKQKTILAAYPLMKTVNLDFEKPDKLISDFCEREKVECFSMLPYFREFTKLEPLTSTYYPFDGHWTEAGTSIVVELLEKILRNYLRIR